MKKIIFALITSVITVMLNFSIATAVENEDIGNEYTVSSDELEVAEACFKVKNGRMVIYATLYCSSHAKTVAQQVEVFLENEATVAKGDWRNPDDNHVYMIPLAK